MIQFYLAALAGFGNLRTEVRPEMLTTFPPQLSESFFSLFLTWVTSFPIGRLRTRSSDDKTVSSGTWNKWNNSIGDLITWETKSFNTGEYQANVLIQNATFKKVIYSVYTFGRSTTWISAVKWSNLLALWAQASNAAWAWALWRQITSKLCRWRKSDSSAAKLMSPDTKMTVAGGG